MAGLPASYLKKYGMKEGWKKYKTDQARKKKKRSGSKTTNRKAATMPKRKTRRTSTRRKAAPRRTYRRRSKSGTMGGIGGNVNARMLTKVVQLFATGSAGAIVSSSAVNAIPMLQNQTPTTKALSQAGIGLAMILAGRKMPAVRVAGIGAGMAAGTSLIRQFLPEIPMLSGNDYYDGLLGANVSQQVPGMMGANVSQQVPALMGAGVSELPAGMQGYDYSNFDYAM